MKLVYLLLVFSLIAASCAVTIMSVDFGSEWIKVAVVAPGIPMEIALNEESKRKTPVAISFRGGEREFGDSAISAGMKSPSLSYNYLLELLGKKIDNPMVELYRKRFPHHNIVEDPVRGTLVFKQDDETTHSVEELVAQILSHAQEMAEAYTKQKTKDLVITVPPFFNQAERRALLNAAEIAGLKVLTLMSTNAAVALNYAMFRRKEINETAQRIMFYDMGASATTASVVEFKTVKTKERGFTETNPQISILGVGYDRTLGGLEFQLRLRDYLGKKFNEVKKTKLDVFESPRALNKLMKEAGRAKYVLSANNEYISQVEGLLDDEDFRLLVRRGEFESLCSDLWPRVRGPLDAALAHAAVERNDVDQLIVVGGSHRVPRVGAELSSAWGGAAPGRSLNADESAAMGAVYRAADLGRGFKVLKVHIKEAVNLPVQVSFERAELTEGSASKIARRSLFSRGDFRPQKKVMTFNKHTSAFTFNVSYGDLTHLTPQQIRWMGGSDQTILHVSVSGVEAAFNKHSLEAGPPSVTASEAKGVKAHFVQEESGLIKVTSIEAVFEKNVTEAVKEEEDESTLAKIGSTISKLFSASEEKNETASDDTKDKNDKTDDKETKEAPTKMKEGKPRMVLVREELDFTFVTTDVAPITEEQHIAAVQKLQLINESEFGRKETARLRNALETYALDVREKLTQKEYADAAKPKDAQNMKEIAKQTEDWLYEEGFDEKASVFEGRLKSLQTLFEPVVNRVQEHRQRPEALQALHDMMNMSSVFLYRANSASESERWFTDVELQTLDKLIINTQKWLEEKEEHQEKLSLSEFPSLTVSMLAEKITAHDREIKYLVNKATLTKAKKEREAAEAAREALKKKNATKTEGTNKTTTEDANKTSTEGGKDDSRAEPPMPVDPDETGQKEEIPTKDESEPPQPLPTPAEGPTGSSTPTPEL